MTRAQAAPAASSPAARRRMVANRRRDTAPEVALRKELHRRGLRFRVDLAALPGSPRRRVDVAFTRVKVAVYVDGCYWHGCPLHGTISATNAEFWRSKINANQRRDADSDERLREAGWTVLRFWEHESAAAAAEVIEAAVRAPTRD